MSTTASNSTHQRSVAPPIIREHRIPTEGAKPYIATEGRDGALWFCESGASKIGRLDCKTYAFTEFALPTANATPIGIIPGPDGNLWFAEKTGNKIGRITPRGDITEFPVPTPNAGPDAMMLGPDGNLWFSETEVSQIGRITPDGKIAEFKDGITPGSKPLSIVVRDGALWFSEAAGNRHLVDIDRELLRPGEHHNRRAADDNGDRHFLTALTILEPVQETAGAGGLARHHPHHRAVGGL